VRASTAVWIALAVLVAGCGPEAELTPPTLAFVVDKKEARQAALEVALRQFLLGQTEQERQRAYEEIKRLDPDEAWILQQSDAEELADDRKDVMAEEARRRFLLGATEAERRGALEELKRLDPDEAEDLEELDAEELADERADAALEAARRQFLLAQTDGERQRAYEEIKRLDPEEAEDLLE